MFKEKILKNENTKPNSREIEKLKLNFPYFFNKNGEFKLDYFKEMLSSEEINFEKEGYELKFLGKNYSRYQAGLETETVLVPDNDHNLKKENNNSENIYIIGDNLEALKHLSKSYDNKIKCIYIDPPYNTGNDGFIYSDDFYFTSKVLSEKMGISEEEAEKIINLKGKSSHSAWLTFMYSRLLIAQSILAEDGVIFISIDENEQANLKLICDDIFGEGNLVADFIWNNKYTVSNDTDVSYQHENIFCYCKNRNIFNLALLPRTEKQNKDYKNRDNDPKGPWKATPLHARSGSENSIYEITFDNGITWKAPQGRYPRYSKETLQNLYDNNELYFNKNGGVDKKTYLSEVRNGVTCGTLWSYEEAGHSHENNEELAEILGKGIFNDPKGTKLLKRILSIATTEKDFIVLDFFSGSATTAQAVMELNSEDNGNRKYIMVQLPEKIKEEKVAYKEGYKSIDEIGRERINRISQRVKEKNPNVDCGFKLFRIEKVNQNLIDKILEFNPEMPTILQENYVDTFSFHNTTGKDTILTTWLNEDGYGLTAKVKKLKLENYEIDFYENTAYIIELGITSEDILKLIENIEENKLLINRIVVYPYSIPFHIIHELKQNIKQLHNNIDLIERY